MPHRFVLRVYWEDTDAAGIVYHANYLNFAERARTEAMLASGLRQGEIRQRLGVVFAVRDARVRYRAPARLEDELVVMTALAAASGARLALRQEVWRDAVLLAEIAVELACLNAAGRPMRLPPEVRAVFAHIG